MKKEETKTLRSIETIARDIIIEWKAPYFGAVPYLSAMRSLNTVNDMYGMDSARNIINYFLANAASWRGEKAREIKSELKSILKK